MTVNKNPLGDALKYWRHKDTDVGFKEILFAYKVHKGVPKYKKNNKIEEKIRGFTINLN